VTYTDLLQLTERGIWCSAGDFYVDPWQPVERAVITHAHSDHARFGSRHYLTTTAGAGVARLRVGDDATIQAVAYGKPVHINGIQVSLHPAGHILGSAQVRIEHRGEVWVVSGDYKTVPDPTCAAFEPVRCHAFITESTFGLPVYRWPNEATLREEIQAWWRANQHAGRASLLFGYALGKAQRLLASVDAAQGPIFTHGAVDRMNGAYRAAGVALPATTHVGAMPRGTDWSRALIVAPPSAHGSAWERKFGDASTAFASGWMRVRGARRRRSVDRGFIVSDHADWPGLLSAVAATGATRVWVTHGYRDVLARRLCELGLDARVMKTRFEGENDEDPENTSAGPEDEA
jgi:putative mRNA 3-end processing factor